MRKFLHQPMGIEQEMKKHIDCDWLIEKSKGVYFCCDTRSPNKGKELDESFIHQEACSFYHSKNDKSNPGFFEDFEPAAVSE